MVKGNAERRKELAAKRKQDRKDEVVRQKAGVSRATPVEIRGRLLHDASIAGAGDNELIAWVAVPSEDGAGASRKDICEAWWRTGFCGLKRCRLSHDESIAHLCSVPESAGAWNTTESIDDGGSKDDQQGKKGAGKGKKGKKSRSGKGDDEFDANGGSLPAMDCMPLKNVDAGGQLAYDRNVRSQRRRESKMLFVAFRGNLVFDAANPEVFVKYASTSPVAIATPGAIATPAATVATAATAATSASSAIAATAATTATTATAATETKAATEAVIVDPASDTSGNMFLSAGKAYSIIDVMEGRTSSVHTRAAAAIAATA
jgi:hypothetical protein